MSATIQTKPVNRAKKKKSINSSKKALKLNVVLFEPFRDAMEISFYDRKPEDPFSDEPPVYELNGNHLPDELEMEMDRDEYLHTRYAAEPGAPYTVSVDPQTTNFLFLKAYGFQKIANYFINEVPGVVVENNFVNQLVVWIELDHSGNGQAHNTIRYERYGLDFYMGRYSGNRQTPELLVSYQGVSEVLDISLSGLSGGHELVNKVITADGRCVRWKDEKVQRRIRPEECHPVLNIDLKKMLNFPFYTKRVHNKYIDQRKKISAFYQTFLDTTTFRRETGLLPKEFFQPDPKQISKEDLNRYPMRFGKGKVAETAYWGLNKYGPFRGAPHPAPWFLIVAPQDSYQLFKQKVVTPLIEGNGYYPGMSRFVNMNPKFLKEPVLYTDLENPEEEVIRKLSEYRFPAGKGAVLFCSSLSKDDQNHPRNKQFFRIKEYLLERGIVSQAFDAEKVQKTTEQNIGWWHQHVSTALLAKLGGIPWVTGESHHKELIIGVSAYKPEWSAEKYTGSAFSFDNGGHFRGFDFFEGEDIRYFCGAVKKALRMFIAEHGSEATERVVIHFYKQLKGKDMRQIMKVMYELNCRSEERRVGKESKQRMGRWQ